jgi:type VI secretion system protein ImpH
LHRSSETPSRSNFADAPPEMTVTFMGLIGPSGVLPQHYTKMVIQRTRDKDFGLRDFLDLFNHRALSLFYRAWEKERFALGYERTQAEGVGEEDLFTRCLYCLIGHGTAGLRGRMHFDDEALLFFAGNFSHHPRSALALERMLCDYFDLAFHVKQFQGQWLRISDEDRSLLPSVRRPQGQNARLGRGFVVGERVWDVQCRFRLRVGTVGYAQFLRLMPSGDMLRSLCELTRLYVGPELDFDVQPMLRGEEAPWSQLGGDGAEAPRLGWNTWIRCQPFQRNVEDAVFSLEDV